MSQLNDLYDKTIKEMSEDELEQKIHSLKRLRIMEPKNPSKIITKSSRGTNKDKQLLDLIKNLSPQDIINLMKGAKNDITA